MIDKTSETIAHLKSIGLGYKTVLFGSKNLVPIKLTNGNVALVDLFTNTAIVSNKKSVKFKNLDKFLEMRGLEAVR